MRRWQRLLRADQQEQRSASIDDYVKMLEAASFVNTTWSDLTSEEIVGTASQAYRANGPIFALVLVRLQVFTQARFQWASFDKGRPGDLFGTPELGVLERPWPGGTTSDLLARMEVDVSTAGNAFIRRKGGRLYRLKPEWVTVMLGSNEDREHPGDAADCELVGYGYRAGGTGPVQMFMPDEVAHYAPIPDPDMHFVGMSWVSPVIQDLQGDSASTIHKRKFFEHAATPNLAIRFDPSIKADQIREFKALFEAEHRGVANAYKTLYLGGGADPVAIGKDFKELEFAATQGKGESRLASAAGVPPSWVGFSEGLQGSALNAGNYSAARRRFGDGTMRHLWASAAASLETIVRPPRGASVHLTYDSRDIPFLREDSLDAASIQAREAQTITNLVKEGFTPESAVLAVQHSDWDRLEHSGRVSIQLQPIEPTDEETPDQPANDVGSTDE